MAGQDNLHLYRYLVLLAQEKFECVLPELESIATSFGLNLSGKSLEKNGCGIVGASPVQLFHSIDEDDVRKIMSRSVLAKSAFEIWGLGRNLSELKQSILRFPSSHKQKYFESSRSFAIRVKGLGKKMKLPMQVEKIDSLQDVLPFEGAVDLVHPDEEFYFIEDYSIRIKGQPPKEPLFMYFGRLICHGQRELIGHYSLKTRKFIGNTSMDAMLGMVMANLGCAMPNTIVCDPFVGTGSLLISAAHFGSYVIGGDINYNILHAQGKSSRRGAGWRQKDETIAHSLSHYGVGHLFVDSLVCDAANHAWRLKHKELFDAIITDPPYGIREACQRVGSTKGAAFEAPELAPGQYHFPEQMAYHLDDVFKDLLTFAADSLVLNGRLVYWLPVHRLDYTEHVVPVHPALRLLYNCEQILNGHSSRRLIVMEKIQPNEVTCENFNKASINSSIYCGHNAFRDKYFKPVVARNKS